MEGKEEKGKKGKEKGKHSVGDRNWSKNKRERRCGKRNLGGGEKKGGEPMEQGERDGSRKS